MSDTEEDDWDEQPDDEDEDAAISEPEEDSDDEEEPEAEAGDDSDDEEVDDKLDAVEEMTGPRKVAPKPAAAPVAPSKPAAKPAKRGSAASAKSAGSAKSAKSAASSAKAPSKKRKSAESSSEEDEDEEDSDDDDEAAAPPPKKQAKAAPLADANGTTDPPAKKLPQKGDARAEIEHLVVEANRPFGVNDVVQRLAPRYDKGVVGAMLDALERQGVLRSKAVVAQQKAYWPDQSKVKAASATDMRDMAGDVRDAKCDAKEADEDAGKLERVAARYLSEPTNADLDAEVAAAEKASTDLEARLKRASQAPPIKPRDMIRAVKKHNEHRALWLKRKRGFKESVEVVADNMDLQPKKLIAAVADAQDVETDEDMGVALPPPDALPVPGK
jgi:hypothetical protein